jgi:hypothetical protein
MQLTPISSAASRKSFTPKIVILSTAKDLLLLLSLLLLLQVLRCHSERSEEPLYFAFVFAFALACHLQSAPTPAKNTWRTSSPKTHIIKQWKK